MKRHGKMFVNGISGLLILGLSQAILAESNPEAGQEKAAMCGGCHGEDGNATAPMFPKLAAQHATYLKKQLHEFKSGKRVQATMNAMAEGLSDEDIDDISAFYAGKTLNHEVLPGNTAGEKLYKAGNAKAGLPACSGCHGPKGSGNAPALFPRLGGQYAAYLESTLHEFKAGQRANDMNAMMRSVAQKLSDEDITAVSEYIESLN